MSKFHGIANYYIEKAYRESVWAHLFEIKLTGLDCDFLEVYPMIVMTDDSRLL